MKTRKQFRSEPPEGGWGYIVSIGLALPFIQILGILPSFGLIYGEFLISIGEQTSAITLIASLFFAAMSFGGLFANSLYQKFSLRGVAVFGASLYFAGAVAQIFVMSAFHLLIAFSLVQGIGSGLLIPALFTTFNGYFVKRRAMVMNCAQTLIGVGTMFYPVVVQKLYTVYGFRGSLIVLAALNSHAIFGALVLHPVEWHMKRVEITEEEMKELNETKEEKKELEVPLMVQHQMTRSLATSRRGSLLSPAKDFRSRASSVASLGHWQGAVVIEDRVSVKSTKKSGVWQSVVDYLDLTLLKDPVYVNMVLGVSFALYSDITFFTLQPMYLFMLGFSKADTATIVAIGAGADLVSRLFLAVSAIFLNIPSRYVYLAGAVFLVISRCAFMAVGDFYGFVIMTGIIGFFKTWVHGPLALVFAEYLSPERFPSGYGLFMFLQGNIMFLIGPVVGYIRDKTQDYILTFHILNVFMAACAVPWLIEIFYIKYANSKKSVKEKATLNTTV